MLDDDASFISKSSRNTSFAVPFCEMTSPPLLALFPPLFVPSVLLIPPDAAVVAEPASVDGLGLPAAPPVFETVRGRVGVPRISSAVDPDPGGALVTCAVLSLLVDPPPHPANWAVSIAANIILITGADFLLHIMENSMSGFLFCGVFLCFFWVLFFFFI